MRVHASVCVSWCVGERENLAEVAISCADSWFYVEPRLPGRQSTEMN